MYFTQLNFYLSADELRLSGKASPNYLGGQKAWLNRASADDRILAHHPSKRLLFLQNMGLNS